MSSNLISVFSGQENPIALCEKLFRRQEDVYLRLFSDSSELGMVKGCYKGLGEIYVSEWAILFSAISGRRGLPAGLGLALAFWMFACAPVATQERAWSDVNAALRQARAEADALGAVDMSTSMLEFFDAVKLWREKL
jgi:hypothetical protein